MSAKKKVEALLTCSADVGRRGRKSRTARQTPGHFVDVSVYDHADEIKKDRGHNFSGLACVANIAGLLWFS